MNDRSTALDALLTLPERSTVVLVGATDTGKTTFAVDAVNALLLRGRLPIAVVDTDIGQSEIGPPGVVGLGTLTLTQPSPIPIRHLSQMPYIAGEFVGATSGASHSLALLSATLRLLYSGSIQRLNPEVTVIDTPGYIVGTGAEYLRSLLSVVKPAMVIAFARSTELEPILRPIASASRATKIVKLTVGPEVGHKSSDERTARRAMRFVHHLRGAQSMLMQWDGVAFENTSLSYGTPLPPHEIRFIGSTLGGTCLYAEKLIGGALVAVMATNPAPKTPAKVGILEQVLKVNRVAACTTDRFDHLLCGLHAPSGEMLDIGLLVAVDFERRRLELFTSLRHPGAVTRLALGYVRLREDGRELGQITPNQAI